MCQAYGAAGHERARARYSWDRVAMDTLRVYHQIAPDYASAEMA